MLVFVLGALSSALGTYFNAFTHEVFGVLGAARHQPSREGTDIGTIPVEENAGHHVVHMLFVQAGRSAPFAGGNAAVQRIKHYIVCGSSSGGSGHGSTDR